MPQVHITETILRDAHQCLIATRMRTEDMLPICDRLDRAGFWSLEVWGGATYDACLRFLKEDPWDRLRKLREALPNTRLQMLLRGQNLVGYRHYADDVVRAFVERAAANGIDVFRIFDALNDTRNLRVAIEAVKQNGKHAQGAISYTTSPVHTIDQFIQDALELEGMGCDSIAIKDMAGLLAPFTAAELVRRLVEQLSIPVHLHSHATAGLSDMCQLKGVENGCFGIDTAISAFANGASHPPTESMVAALRDTEHDTGLDLQLLQEIGFYFREVRRKYHQFESEFTGLDTRVQVNQVPGGMISNLYSQLKEQGALERMGEVLNEIPSVREDLGYPPLVTPTSQIVGTQAVLNVLTGRRYKTITNEVKHYLQGRYGRPPGHVNFMVRQQAIGNEDVIDVRPADLLHDELESLREQIGELAESEEDVLSFAMFPEVGRKFLEERAAGTLTPEPLEPQPGPREEAQGAPVEFNVTLHGETYHIKLTGTGHKTQQMRPFYMTVDGVPEEIMVETLDEILPEAPAAEGRAKPGTGSQRPRATAPGHVTTSMPGTIIDVLVRVGDEVSAGDPVLITEAMKMETEVQAPIAGKVAAVHVAKGDSVNPDETLVEID
ncbi:MAG: sodium-extruding oxaloacetate decarboxylase subunit alpha [Gammaproteobacteria bacterium]|nr:sodium-extruding oxaloacetate decarboxylase subunit alpha [Gammaproteobacteria bacterium]NIR96683.1 sodium-extruding oxaloacetate decarboxylase subunit alpha [Gammaproteobacteria bacterium]NIT62387.1 sodium-extruding oxaloacetate decarboxylase subunit alpha [Gammaproteobacteria bacterium]NIV19319.1 sodium-extruding oxaloacetate decarboxylase subunit alpha [Gammaproteobacteria bacterium]NIX10280.1 sodium-extruding oxaloacetate decarboxylase subunit alpha [Gammaproteobacteria bacterium]